MSTIIKDIIKDATSFYYLKNIKEIDCYFNNSGETDGDYAIYKFSKKFDKYPTTGGSAETADFYKDIIENDLGTDIADLEKKAQKVIDNTKNITYGGTKLCDSLSKTFNKYINKSFVTPNNQKESEFNYKIVPDLIKSIIVLREKLTGMKEKYSCDSIKNKIPEVKDVYLTTDVENAWECSYGYHLQNKRMTDKTSWSFPVDKILTFELGGKKIEFELPSKAELLKVFAEYKNYYTAYGTKCIFNNNFKNPLEDEKVNKISETIDEFINDCTTIISNLRTITSKYSNMEKNSKKKYINALESSIKKEISKKKTEIDVDKVNKKIEKLQLVVGEEKASKWLQKQIKKTGAKVCLADGVISIVKKKASADKKKKKSSSKSSKSSNATTSMAATGATVVATKVRKSTKAKTTKKARKTTSKDEKTKKMKGKVAGNTKKGVVTTVSTLASLQAEKKQLQNNTAVKISNIKTEANNRIADIEGKAEDEKKLAEIEKNNTIKQINDDAANKINAIDPNDSEASTKIENIQTEAENAIKNADEKYENRVNEIEAKKNQDVSQVENSRENDIKSVEEKSNKELKEINDDIEKAKKTKSSKKSVQTMAKTSSKATETKAETKEYKSNVSDNDVETSGTAADDSFTKVDEAVSNKHDEITAAEQAKENTSSSDSSANVAQPETTTSTPEQSTSTSVETDTSSNNTNYSTSGASTSSNYNNSYDADESYSAGDYNTIEQQKQADINSSNTGVDQSTLKSDSTTKSTFDIKKDTTSSTLSSNKDIDDISSISSTKSTSSKKSSGLGAAVPIGLGIAATGAAAVAGVRYVKNKKLNEDYDENYDDENNDVYEDEVPSDSAYMADDYLGPEGSSYTEVPDDNEYTDAEALEEEAGVSDFSEDAALNELN